MSNSISFFSTTVYFIASLLFAPPHPSISYNYFTMGCIYCITGYEVSSGGGTSAFTPVKELDEQTPPQESLLDSRKQAVKQTALFTAYPGGVGRRWTFTCKLHIHNASRRVLLLWIKYNGYISQLSAALCPVCRNTRPSLQCVI